MVKKPIMQVVDSFDPIIYPMDKLDNPNLHLCYQLDSFMQKEMLHQLNMLFHNQLKQMLIQTSKLVNYLEDLTLQVNYNLESPMDVTS